MVYTSGLLVVVQGLRARPHTRAQPRPLATSKRAHARSRHTAVGLRRRSTRQTRRERRIAVPWQRTVRSGRRSSHCFCCKCCGQAPHHHLFCRDAARPIKHAPQVEFEHACVALCLLACRENSEFSRSFQERISAMHGKPRSASPGYRRGNQKCLAAEAERAMGLETLDPMGHELRDTSLIRIIVRHGADVGDLPSQTGRA